MCLSCPQDTAPGSLPSQATCHMHRPSSLLQRQGKRDGGGDGLSQPNLHPFPLVSFTSLLTSSPGPKTHPCFCPLPSSLLSLGDQPLTSCRFLLLMPPHLSFLCSHATGRAHLGLCLLSPRRTISVTQSCLGHSQSKGHSRARLSRQGPRPAGQKRVGFPLLFISFFCDCTLSLS